MEGCLVLAMLTVTTAMAYFFALSGCVVEIFCDNDEAMRYGNMKFHIRIM